MPSKPNGLELKVCTVYAGDSGSDTSRMRRSNMLATILESPTYDALVNQLGTGTSATNGWDIVCSYGVDALNKVLQDSHTQGRIDSKISVTADRTNPLSHKKSTITFNLDLGAPTLRFIAGMSGFCELSIPISSATYDIVEDDSNNSGSASSSSGAPDSSTLPAGYSIIARVPLAATFGDTSVSAAAAGQVVTFEADSTASMVIHFKAGSSTGTKFDIDGPDPGVDYSDLIYIYMLPAIEKYFSTEVTELDYCLAALTNKPSDSTVMTIDPKSFIFASDTGILSLYIQTSNSGNPQGDLNPVFEPGGVEMLAVPDGKTASLIFSKQFIQNLYLLPVMQKSGTVQIDDVTGSSDEVKGLHFTLVPTQSTLTIAPGVHPPRDNGADDNAVSIDSINIDFNALPIKISLVKDIGAVDWHFSQDLEWEWMKSTNPKGEPTISKGDLTVTIDLNYSISMTNVTDDSLTLDFEVGADQYNVTSPDGFWDEIIDDPATIQTTVQAAVPALNFNFGGINFFAASNLLFPNKSSFKIDTVKGISVPGDLLIVGDIS